MRNTQGFPPEPFTAATAVITPSMIGTIKLMLMRLYFLLG